MEVLTSTTELERSSVSLREEKAEGKLLTTVLLSLRNVFYNLEKELVFLDMTLCTSGEVVVETFWGLSEQALNFEQHQGLFRKASPRDDDVPELREGYKQVHSVETSDSHATIGEENKPARISTTALLPPYEDHASSSGHSWERDPLLSATERNCPPLVKEDIGIPLNGPDMFAGIPCLYKSRTMTQGTESARATLSEQVPSEILLRLQADTESSLPLAIMLSACCTTESGQVMDPFDDPSILSSP